MTYYKFQAVVRKGSRVLWEGQVRTMSRRSAYVLAVTEAYVKSTHEGTDMSEMITITVGKATKD